MASKTPYKPESGPLPSAYDPTVDNGMTQCTQCGASCYIPDAPSPIDYEGYDDIYTHWDEAHGGRDRMTDHQRWTLGLR